MNKIINILFFTFLILFINSIIIYIITYQVDKTVDTKIKSYNTEKTLIKNIEFNESFESLIVTIDNKYYKIKTEEITKEN